MPICKIEFEAVYRNRVDLVIHQPGSGLAKWKTQIFGPKLRGFGLLFSKKSKVELTWIQLLTSKSGLKNGLKNE